MNDFKESISRGSDKKVHPNKDKSSESKQEGEELILEDYEETQRLCLEEIPPQE